MRSFALIAPTIVASVKAQGGDPLAPVDPIPTTPATFTPLT